ncbi:MAG: hypothetical protein V3S60_10715 [Acidimicrobiia bacterium]
MVDLERRLSERGDLLERDYPTISLTELSDRLDVVAAIPVPAPAVRPFQPRPKPLTSAPRRRRLRVALAAVMVGLIIAGVAWLTRGTPDGEVIDQPTVTSIPTPTTTPLLSSLTWSRVFVFGGATMRSVTVGGPGLVAVGQAGPGEDGEGSAAVWTSPDGAIWTRVPHDAALFGGADMESITVGGPGLVAVGEDADGDAVVWTSADGVTWSRVFHHEGGGATMNSVTVGGPGLVAVGSDGGGQTESSNAVVWTSPDGIDWSRVPHNEAIFGGPAYRLGVESAHVGMTSVSAGGPGLVAVGWDWPHAAVWTSVDGITWARVPHDEAMQSASCSPPSGSCFDGAVGLFMRSVTVGGPGLVAVGFDGHPDAENAVVWTSDDGVTWSRVPHDEAIFGGPEIVQMNGVTAGGPGLVAVGGATVWTSVDGINWSRIPHNEAVFGGEVEMRSVTAGGPGLVAVGGDWPSAAVWNAGVED